MQKVKRVRPEALLTNNCVQIS
uniref:Uncharacterized protein n=1 Tax=Rhizophora mucronata TaxID=61149 RepID=A0A2P2P3H4_RHIMU